MVDRLNPMSYPWPHTKNVGLWVDSRARQTYVSYCSNFVYTIYISNLVLSHLEFPQCTRKPTMSG